MNSSFRADTEKASFSSLPDPAIAEFLDLRLEVARIPLASTQPESGFANARAGLREIGRNANVAIRKADVKRTDELFASVCFAARSHIAEARGRLAGAALDYPSLVLARRALYRALSLIAEALSASEEDRAWPRPGSIPPSPPRGVLFAAFVTQVVAATRANTRDIAWALEVAESEVTVAVAHPHFQRVSAERRSMLRALRGEIAAWFGGERNADAGYGLLNRLVLLIDCLQ